MLTPSQPPRPPFPHTVRVSSPLGTAKGLVKQGGELVAVPHYIKPTGYKAPNAYGAKDIFSGET